MAALLFINDIQVPSMSRELMIELQTLVSAGKNANGELCGSKVGRDQYKLNDLEWPRLTAHEWSVICKECEKFILNVRFPSMVNEGKWETLQMYPGNRSAKILEQGSDGLPTKWKECKVNIIDCGYLE